MRGCWGMLAIMAAVLATLWGQTFAHAAQDGQKTFASPDTAVQALIQAVRQADNKALLEIFGPEAEDILDSGPAAGQPRPYHGYYYRLLQSQGEHASGGAFDYVVQGNMLGGFAVVAYPAEYGDSGVMTFIVNHEGVVYQKDLGPDTAQLASTMSAFDPDASWAKVE